MGGGTSMGFFSCPGDCGKCDLTREACPIRGAFGAASSEPELSREEKHSKIALLIASALQPHLERSAINLLTPDVLVKRLEKEIGQLMQAVEIIEDAGGEITREELAKDIFNLVPMYQFQGLPETIKEKLAGIAAVVALKLIQISKRACLDQGSACADCYMESVCTQRQQGR